MMSGLDGFGTVHTVFASDGFFGIIFFWNLALIVFYVPSSPNFDPAAQHQALADMSSARKVVTRMTGVISS